MWPRPPRRSRSGGVCKHRLFVVSPFCFHSHSPLRCNCPGPKANQGNARIEKVMRVLGRGAADPIAFNHTFSSTELQGLLSAPPPGAGAAAGGEAAASLLAPAAARIGFALLAGRPLTQALDAGAATGAAAAAPAAPAVAQRPIEGDCAICYGLRHSTALMVPHGPPTLSPALLTHHAASPPPPPLSPLPLVEELASGEQIVFCTTSCGEFFIFYFIFH